MTNKEAVDELKILFDRLSNPKDCEQGAYSFSDGYYVEALGMAIKALEDKPTGTWLKINNPNYSPFDGTCGELSVCPFCGYKTMYKPHKFCPDCGARMEAENDTN